MLFLREKSASNVPSRGRDGLDTAYADRQNQIVPQSIRVNLLHREWLDFWHSSDDRVRAVCRFLHRCRNLI